MPSAWTELRAAVDPLARRYNLYTAYRIGQEEFIRDVHLPMGVHDARYFLKQNGYEPQYLSAAKVHPGAERPWDDEDLHVLSYRRVPSEHPPEAAGKNIEEEFEPWECQYHVHVFEFVCDISVLEFYSHYEPRPDFLSPTPSWHRLRTHYRPEYGEDYLRGVSDLVFTEV